MGGAPQKHWLRRKPVISSEQMKDEVHLAASDDFIMSAACTKLKVAGVFVVLPPVYLAAGVVRPSKTK